MKTPALFLPDPSLDEAPSWTGSRIARSPAAPPSPSLLLAPSVSEVERAESAKEKRAANPLFRLTWSLSALAPCLPFPFPVDPSSPPSPKTRYRSHYCPPEPGPLFDQTRHNNMSDFEFAVHLADFSALERPLAQFYRQSRKGQIPFHPVSMFLAVSLRIETNMSWRKVATLLAGEHGAGWRRLFGFQEGETPSASGLRYFYQSVGPEPFAELGPAWAQMLRGAALFPLHSTYPGDPPEQGVTMTQDGMLHDALSRPPCELATDECYRPLPESQAAPGEPPSEGGASADDPAKRGASSPDLEMASPTPASDEPCSTGESGLCPGRSSRSFQRPCRAASDPERSSGRSFRRGRYEGCLCNTASCQQQCQRASSLDRQARFIHYEGRNGGTVGPDGPQEKNKEEKGRGRNVFGYRSVADRVLDDRWAVAWTVASDLHPATSDERAIFLEGLIWLQVHLPWLSIGEWLDDAGVGFEECLKAIWALGALRMVDIRADKDDGDFEVCLRRGYEGHGYPLCAHGYVMHSNGYDHERRRTKWVCNQACRREPRREKEPVSPVEGCPYLDETRPLGQVRNVALAFPNGSVRLAREIPFGSQAWKARYGRRNLSESRNGQMEGLHLKRMRSFGLERNRKDIRLADFLLNLRTLGRLVREATDPDGN